MFPHALSHISSMCDSLAPLRRIPIINSNDISFASAWHLVWWIYWHFKTYFIDGIYHRLVGALWETVRECDPTTLHPQQHSPTASLLIVYPCFDKHQCGAPACGLPAVVRASRYLRPINIGNNSLLWLLWLIDIIMQVLFRGDSSCNQNTEANAFWRGERGYSLAF